MLAAAGLGGTWLFRKARVLAIFDDVDTVLLIILLKMLMVGLAWQLGFAVFVMATMLTIAYIWLHRVRMPITWTWVLGSAILARCSRRSAVEKKPTGVTALLLQSVCGPVERWVPVSWC